MPHLQFEINRKASVEEKRLFAESIMTLFSDIMDTGKDHISISIREFDTYNLFIGRVEDNSEGVAIVNTDVRTGRELRKKRELTLGFMGVINDIWSIPHQNIYVTITEHKGEDFHLHERYLNDWQEGEDPLS